MKANQRQQKRHRTVQPARKRLQSLCASPGRILNIQGLPDDVMDRIFSKLKFKNKICVGLVCKQWDRLLKAGTGSLRHWVVDYNLDTCVSKGSDPSRWLINRAAAIKHVRVTATLTSDEQGDATRRILDSQLPLLANSLSKDGATLNLKFHGLLQEITLDISKLINLKSLALQRNGALKEMPIALTTLANLTCLCIMNNEGIRIPCSLQGLECLTTVTMMDCWLKAIPEALTGLANLTSLDVSENDFHSGHWEIREWWPPTLSRLSKLADLSIFECGIVNLPSDISAFGQLTCLDVGRNKLSDLPWQLSSLQNLKELWASSNQFRTVPVHVFSPMMALTSIRFTSQGYLEEGERYEDPFDCGSEFDEESCYSGSDEDEDDDDEEEEDDDDHEDSGGTPQDNGGTPDDDDDDDDDGAYNGGTPLGGPSTLSKLDLSCNSFDSCCDKWDVRGWDGSLRWPISLPRLANLGELLIPHCGIRTLSPEISGLRQLTKLDVSGNKLCSLREDLSRLRNLRDLVANCNSFPTVPVSVLSRMTALTSISLRDQRPEGSETFKVTSPLLPMLHAGLVKLDLSQKTPWDWPSLRYLQRAVGDVADKAPKVTVEYVPRD